MKVKTMNGMELEITVEGYQQKPILKLVAPTEIQNRKIAGRITTGHSREAGCDGIFAANSVFFRATEAVQAIQDEIAKLPRKIYRIYLGKETINADGDMIEVPRWTHENGGVSGASQSGIVKMLEEAHITDISVDDAAKMWGEHVAETRRPFIEAAQTAGEPVEFRREVVECTDPKEECSADIAITYMHADGTTHTEYTHTY